MLAVLGALVANGLITILKFIAAIFTGSSGMMAETLHSLADTTNQVFLLLGLRFYKRPASEKHPFALRQGTFFLVVYRRDFYFRSRCNLRYLRRHRKNPASARNHESKFGLLDFGNILCAGSRLDCEAHPSVVKVVELLTMHLAPKQILVNAHINLKSELSNTEIVQTIAEVEEAMKKAEPKVDMIFLETASLRDTNLKEVNPKHIG